VQSIHSKQFRWQTHSDGR